MRNQLIINQGVDQTVLIAELEAGMDFMFSGNRPHNVKQCFTFNDARRGWGTRLAFTGSGAQQTGPIRAWDRATRLETDVNQQLRYEF